MPVTLGTRSAVQPMVDPAEACCWRKGPAPGAGADGDPAGVGSGPGAAGDVLGTLTVTQNGETLLEVPIRAAETVEKLTFGEMFLRLARTMCFCG